MSFITRLLHKIGHFFGDLFNAAEKTWHKLSPEIQNALLHGSAIIEAINSNIDQTPKFILELIQTKYPDLTLDNIKHGIAEINKGLNIAEGINSDDLEATIANLQKYLSQQKGKTWAAISHAMAGIFAIATAPAGTKFAVVSSLLEFVYQRFIKKEK